MCECVFDVGFYEIIVSEVLCFVLFFEGCVFVLFYLKFMVFAVSI